MLRHLTEFCREKLLIKSFRKSSVASSSSAMLLKLRIRLFNSPMTVCSDIRTLKLPCLISSLAEINLRSGLIKSLPTNTASSVPMIMQEKMTMTGNMRGVRAAEGIKSSVYRMM